MTTECQTCFGTGEFKDNCKKCIGTGYFRTEKTCRKCNGTGFVNGYRGCYKCDGSGTFTIEGECNRCQGSGDFTGTCNNCKGSGRVRCGYRDSLGRFLPKHMPYEEVVARGLEDLYYYSSEYKGSGPAHRLEYNPFEYGNGIANPPPKMKPGPKGHKVKVSEWKETRAAK